MAKIQRWRRKGSGTDPVVPADPIDDPTAAADIDTDHPTATFDALEPEAETGHEAEAVESVVDQGADDEPTDHHGDDEPTGLEPDAPADEQPADDWDDAASLPHVEEQSRLARLLLGGRRPAEVTWWQLVQAAHAKQAVTTALAMAFVAALAGRPPREAGVVLVTVLVGQTILGWHNDIVDRRRDQAHGNTRKPIAMGRLTTGTAWYAIVAAVLLLVPLAVTTGIRAGSFYLASVAVGMLGNVLLRRGVLSFWSWAVSFALLPGYLSYGGWGGQAVGPAPETAVVALAAALGVGVHFMRSVWGLLADHEDGWTYLPLRLGLRIGATRLLALSTVYTGAIVISLAVAGSQVGLSR